MNPQERWDTRSASFSIDKFLTKKDSNGRIIQAGGIQSKILLISPAVAEPAGLVKPYMTDFQTTVKLCTYLLPVNQRLSHQILTVY